MKCTYVHVCDRKAQTMFEKCISLTDIPDIRSLALARLAAALFNPRLLMAGLCTGNRSCFSDEVFCVFEDDRTRLRSADRDEAGRRTTV